MYQPSGRIGSFKYYTLEDLQIMYYNVPEDNEDSANYLKTHGMLDIAALLKEYAVKLAEADYESRYLDNGR